MSSQINFFTKNRKSFKTSRNILFSFKFALSGLVYCFNNTRNFRVQILFAFLIILCSFIFGCNLNEFRIIISTIFSVLSLELINTAIESIVDLKVKQNFNKLAKISKDCSAASVLLASLNSVFVAVFIFFPKIKLILFS